uniref:magnesium chelatase n=1 Tax=Chromera velia CCMP2878 TaxID=1169474 RepID=A0A0G4GAA1_9ALVE|eukprot:Cvel_20932.t1-p1 / transcript=Cvel_20932.t1 / gene=Cvel_20932 / organism=Chromera_velia_CCMP2878 / gene_product=hypothetical protein / transcript_product=hypothetical protein / location=Cvel_scaffold1922:8759-13312(+) / protein_length=921 / sequence_SO=supercontig / SO=protein_coding / is_pseudo=false
MHGRSSNSSKFSSVAYHAMLCLFSGKHLLIRTPCTPRGSNESQSQAAAKEVLVKEVAEALQTLWPSVYICEIGNSISLSDIFLTMPVKRQMGGGRARERPHEIQIPNVLILQGLDRASIQLQQDLALLLETTCLELKGNSNSQAVGGGAPFVLQLPSPFLIVGLVQSCLPLKVRVLDAFLFFLADDPQPGGEERDNDQGGHGGQAYRNNENGGGGIRIHFEDGFPPGSPGMMPGSFEGPSRRGLQPVDEACLKLAERVLSDEEDMSRIRKVHVDMRVDQYIRDVIVHLRNSPLVRSGRQAAPILAAFLSAAERGTRRSGTLSGEAYSKRTKGGAVFVTPQHVKAVAPSVLAHRIKPAQHPAPELLNDPSMSSDPLQHFGPGGSPVGGGRGGGNRRDGERDAVLLFGDGGLRGAPQAGGFFSSGMGTGVGASDSSRRRKPTGGGGGSSSLDSSSSARRRGSSSDSLNSSANSAETSSSSASAESSHSAASSASSSNSARESTSSMKKEEKEIHLLEPPSQMIRKDERERGGQKEKTNQSTNSDLSDTNRDHPNSSHRPSTHQRIQSSPSATRDRSTSRKHTPQRSHPVIIPASDADDEKPPAPAAQAQPKRGAPAFLRRLSRGASALNVEERERENEQPSGSTSVPHGNRRRKGRSSTCGADGSGTGSMAAAAAAAATAAGEEGEAGGPSRHRLGSQDSRMAFARFKRGMRWSFSNLMGDDEKDEGVEGQRGGNSQGGVALASLNARSVGASAHVDGSGFNDEAAAAAASAFAKGRHRRSSSPLSALLVPIQAAGGGGQQSQNVANTPTGKRQGTGGKMWSALFPWASPGGPEKGGGAFGEEEGGNQEAPSDMPTPMLYTPTGRTATRLRPTPRFRSLVEICRGLGAPRCVGIGGRTLTTVDEFDAVRWSLNELTVPQGVYL